MTTQLRALLTAVGTSVLATAASAQSNSCSTSIFDEVEPGLYTFDLSAFANNGETFCGSSATSPDAYFSFVAPRDGTLIASTCGTHDAAGLDTGMDTVLSLHSGCPASVANTIACNDDAFAGGFGDCFDADQGTQRDSLVSLAMTQGEVVAIRASGFNGSAGVMTLAIDFQIPTPTTCFGFGLPAITEGTWMGDLTTATPSGDATCGSSTGNVDAWWRYDPLADGTLTVSTCGTNDLFGADTGVDTVLALFSQCQGDPLTTQIACSDDSPACGGQSGLIRDSLVSVPVSQGESVYIRVSHFGSSTPGPFRLQVQFDQMQNDTCTTATPISAGFYQGTLFGAASDGIVTCGLASGSPTAWYSFTAPGAGTLNVDTCGTHDFPYVDAGVDTVLSLHSGCPGDPVNLLACNDDNLACGELGLDRDSFAMTPMAAGQEVLIRVSNYNAGSTGGPSTIDGEGPFFLNLEFLPENDLCMDAAPVGEGTIMGFIAGSTTGSCGVFEQWFEYVPAFDGTVQIDTCGTNDLGGVDTGADTVLGAYAGCSDLIAYIACNDDDFSVCSQQGLFRDSAISFDVTAGTPYLISLAAFSSTSVGEEFILNITLDAQFSYLCNGDGGNQMGCTDCPCGNNAPPGTIGGCINQSGNSAWLIPDDSPSVSVGITQDLSFDVVGGNPNTLAVLTSGDNVAPQNPANPCFGQNSGLSGGTVLDGLRCAVGNTQRHGGRTMDANGDIGLTNNGWGAANGPNPTIAFQGGFVAGQTRYFQVFYRADVLQSCGNGQNTTQAVSVTFEP